MAGVLTGLRILDLSWGIAGPMATMLMADHGAQVTRIERPGGPPFPRNPGERVWNRGKRSAELDLTKAEDREVLLRLAGAADVLIESYAPGCDDLAGDRLRHAARREPAPGVRVDHRLRQEHAPRRPPGLRRAGGGARRPAVGGARLERQPHGSHQGARCREPRDGGSGRDSHRCRPRGSHLPRDTGSQRARRLSRHAGGERRAACARGDRARAVGRDLPASGHHPVGLRHLAAPRPHRRTGLSDGGERSAPDLGDRGDRAGLDLHLDGPAGVVCSGGGRRAARAAGLPGGTRPHQHRGAHALPGGGGAHLQEVPRRGVGGAGRPGGGVLPAGPHPGTGALRPRTPGRGLRRRGGGPGPGHPAPGRHRVSAARPQDAARRSRAPTWGAHAAGARGSRAGSAVGAGQPGRAPAPGSPGRYPGRGTSVSRWRDPGAGSSSRVWVPTSSRSIPCASPSGCRPTWPWASTAASAGWGST